MLLQRHNDLDEMILQIHLKGLRKHLIPKCDIFANSNADTIQNAISLLDHVGLESNSKPGIICGFRSSIENAIGSVNTGSFIFFYRTQDEVKEILESVKTPPLKAKVSESVLNRMASERFKDVYDCEYELAYDGNKYRPNVEVPEIRTVAGLVEWVEDFRQLCNDERARPDTGEEIKRILRFCDRPDVDDNVVSRGYDLYCVKTVQGE